MNWVKLSLVFAMASLPLICTENVAHAVDDKKPNILLIMADDVGCDAIGCYGGQSYPTPHIDALAKSGMKFTHGYSMPVCHPTRICMMTGKYPFRFGPIGSRWGDFPPTAEENAIGNRLKAAGYSTAVAGKWQLCMMKNDVDHPRRLGFDEWCLFGWHEGGRYDDPLIYQNGVLRKDTKGKFGPDLYVDFLSKFMERCHENDQPFFAYFPMALCHDVTDDLKGKHVAFYKEDRWMNYAEMMGAMDDCVGTLMKKLESLKIRDNTLVIFTTDNGTAAASYFRVNEKGKMVRHKVFSIRDGAVVPGGKGKTDDTGTRVPLIASWPGKVKAGSTSDVMVDMTDFLPTLAEVAGAPKDPKRRDGVSFAATLTGKKTDQPRREWIFIQHKGKRCVRSTDWKLYDDGRLFDLRTDPLEKSPIRTADDDQTSKSNRIKLESVLRERLQQKAK